MKCARLIFAIVSTTNIPNSLPQIFEGASVQNYQGGHFWTPITPIMGSTLHAYPHFPFVWSLDRDQNVAKSSKLKHRNSSAVTIRYPAEMFTYIFMTLLHEHR